MIISIYSMFVKSNIIFVLLFTSIKQSIFLVENYSFLKSLTAKETIESKNK